jgi:hypothetical protein
MGPASVCCKRLDAAQAPPATRPNPGPAIDPRLIISGGFDKGSRQESIEGTESPSAQAFIRFFTEKFATVGPRKPAQ